MADTTVIGTGPSATIASLQQPTKVASTPNNALDKDAFLKLLVAQIKYQNPMQPMDSTALMAQTSQLTMVEKMESMDATATKQNASTNIGVANGFIGRQVTWRVEGVPQTAVVSSARLTADGAFLKVVQSEITLDQIETVSQPTAATVPPTS
jgi:flagellar basal-body rod modification protein FlgD